ncbi:Conserved membrane protein of uncharacterised function [Mycobacterium tuberculosis]|nr:Conserved membrane protein of uncharacterised function [Mycobacterium tuberculosis]CKT64023.1 Conserved membrane protein of uncharacterised function [Mycobacterium tuberculosis]CKT87618.1 Conserved membrane protein of uncharacterised function [Mycobacterium tuberculosis]CNM26095.1 Conserved membrane protein of uncharacterised function [Mycobacterium tuberculosis]SGL97059.1 Conserved membrane protein of uncharacterised function [Mycobacterium tuberculosis]
MNLTDTVATILAILALTAGTGVFVAAEFSLTALDRSTVEANARGGTSRDRFIQRAHHRLSFQLSGAQLGISITTLATGYLTEPLVAELPHPGLVAVGMSDRVADGLITFFALVIVTSLSMVFGELVPKYLAVARPLRTARSVVAGQVLFSLLLTPAIRLTNGAANWIVRRLGIEPAEELRSARTPQELVSLVRSSARSGALDDATAWLMRRSLQFGALTAEELMTPRSKIVALQTDDTIADLVAAAAASGFSRFPVVEGDLDATVGIVHVKQVFEVPPGDRAHTLLTTVAEPVAVVPSTLDGDAVMAQVRASALQTAMVVDEYGGTAGMVTLEDLIEEIVGDVRDEHDDATPDVVAAGNGWRVSGLLRIDEVASATGYRAPDGPYETISGLVLRELGHIPVAGETVELTALDQDGLPDDSMRWLATVIQMDGRRIDLLELIKMGGHADPGAGPLMDVLSAVLLALLLIGANAFFVGAEFALISARRDRLEALAEQGKATAVTVIRAGEQLPAMLTGAQLGVTVSSILLGRVGEPAVVKLLQLSFGLSGVPPALLHTLSLAIVVALHVLLGEMVPKNIALAGPERTAMLLVPPYLVYVRLARPFIAFYNNCANAILRLVGVQPKDELDIAVSTAELSEMIAESLSEGLLDHEEHTRLTRALRIRTRLVADVAVPLVNIRAVQVSAVGSGPTIGGVEQALAQTGYSRFPVVDRGGRFIGYLHIKDVLTLGDNPQTVIDLAVVRPLPRVPQSLPLADALSRMRRINSHLALVTADNGSVVGMVALEDVVEDLVGTMRDGTHR